MLPASLLCTRVLLPVLLVAQCLLVFVYYHRTEHPDARMPKASRVVHEPPLVASPPLPSISLAPNLTQNYTSDIRIYILPLPPYFHSQQSAPPHHVKFTKFVELEPRFERLLRQSDYVTTDPTAATHFYAPV